MAIRKEEMKTCKEENGHRGLTEGKGMARTGRQNVRRSMPRATS